MPVVYSIISIPSVICFVFTGIPFPISLHEFIYLTCLYVREQLQYLWVFNFYSEIIQLLIHLARLISYTSMCFYRLLPDYYDAFL